MDRNDPFGLLKSDDRFLLPKRRPPTKEEEEIIRICEENFIAVPWRPICEEERKEFEEYLREHMFLAPEKKEVKNQ